MLNPNFKTMDECKRTWKMKERFASIRDVRDQEFSKTQDQEYTPRWRPRPKKTQEKSWKQDQESRTSLASIIQK